MHSHTICSPIFQCTSDDLELQSYSLFLQELLKLGTTEDRLCLLEGLNLLIACCLADFEVLRDEIAALMELGVVVRELLKLKQSGLLVLICLGEVLLRLGLLLRLVGHGLGLFLDRRVGLLDEIFVCFLGILFRANRLGLHCLGIVDNLLDHAHNAASGLVLLVLLEARRRGRACWLLLLQEGGLLLLVEALQDVESCLKQLLGGTLIRNSLLELLVLLLAVLAGTLHLHLHLSDLRLEGLDLTGQCLDLELQVLDQGEQVLLFVLLLLSLELVGVEL